MVEFYQIPPILTDRERETLALMMQGLSREEMAQELGISSETAKIHTRNLLRKFDAVNLRDGINQISAYNDYYGVNGKGHSRFMTKNVFNVGVSENREDLSYHLDLEFQVIWGEFSGYRGNFNSTSNDATFQFIGLEARDFVREGPAIVVDLWCEKIKKGGSKSVEIFANLPKQFDGENGFDAHRNSIPCVSKTLIYTFPKNRLPKIITAKLHSGYLPLDASYCYQKIENNKYIFHIEPVVMGSIFELQWQW